ncbi:hypothetical protein F4782DRAFT_534597 [Xylaria castorea]|nr:hypothetical protein F4782DRAFT_534597 [Xylaria castorea]
MVPQPLQIRDLDLDGPALRPPPNVVPDFEHPWNLNTIGLLTNALCLIATISACSIRAYAKLFCIRKIELEDVIMLFALGTYLASVWCSYHIIETSGSFTHQWNIRLKDVSSTFYVGLDTLQFLISEHLNVDTCFWQTHHLGFNFIVVTLGLTKAAILLEWTRIFVPYGTRNLFYWVYKALLAAVCLTHIALIVIENVSCIPHEKIWDITITSGSCISEKIYHIPGALIDLTSILIILVLAQRAIWNLKMSLNNKIGVSLIFLVGVLALGSSIARAVATFRFLDSKDKTHSISALYLWALAELTCSFLAFCAPTAPRAYADRRKIAEFMAYLVKRVGVPTKSRLSRIEASSWPSSVPSSIRAEHWDSSKRYHRIRGRASLLAKHQTAKETGQSHYEPMREDAILVTTTFTAEITRLTEPRNDHVESMEYPWTREQ